MIVYHGSIDIVPKPDIEHSFHNLDFGKGFYVTSVKIQAERWALRKADLLNKKAIVNIYQYQESDNKYNIKDFFNNDSEWIDFVCSCRDGNEDNKKFDIIQGKAADDKVYRVVNFYKTGVWDKERAIREMKAYDLYDQIAFVSQKAIDSLLVFQNYYEIAK